jgi:hypothetical protein
VEMGGGCLTPSAWFGGFTDCPGPVTDDVLRDWVEVWDDSMARRAGYVVLDDE